MKLPAQPFCILIYGLLLVGISACADMRSANSKALSALPEVDCSVITGSRVMATDQRCSAQRKSFTGQEIQNTGEVSVGRALSMLDPAIAAARLDP